MFINRLRIVFLIISLYLLFFNLSKIVAMGSYEDVYKEAQQLYIDKEYNEAIKVLSNMLKKDSEQMEKAQKLLNKIRIAQEKYNFLFSQLITAYNERDLETAFEIIKQLEEIDPNPNEASKLFLEKARNATGFILIRNRFLEIMEKAAGELETENYSEAIETYMTGFDLGLEEFINSGCDSGIIDELAERSKREDELALEFISLLPEMQESYLSLVEAYNNKNADDIIATEVSLKEFFTKAAEIREELRNIAFYYRSQEVELKDTIENELSLSHLVFMDKLITGRSDVDHIEGIAGTIDLVWKLIFNDTNEKLVAFTTELFENYYEKYLENRLETDKEELAKIELIANTSLSVIEQGLSQTKINEESESNGILLADIEKIKADDLYIRQLIEITNEFPLILEKYKIADDIKKKYLENLAQEEFDTETAKEINNNILSEILQLEESIKLWDEKIVNIEDIPLNDRTIKKAEIPKQEYQNIYDSLITISTEIAVKTADLDFENYKKEFTELEELINTSIDEIKKNNIGNDIIKISDDIAKTLKDAQSRLSELNTMILELDQRLDKYQAEKDDPMAIIKEKVKTLSENSNLLLEETMKYNKIAEDNKFMAEKLRQEGDKRIEEAKALSKQGRYAATRKRLEQAVEKYDESLLYEDNPELLTRRDEEVKRIFDEIRTSENILVVKEVRENLNNAKKAYTEGNFKASENFLVQAQTRWSDTNSESNSEIEYWLNLVRTALTVTAGRTIELTDPLYAEMNQYLNQAYKDLEMARERINVGKKNEAIQYFDNADKSILHVKKFFPLNEEASVLKLKISRYRDPESFKDIFGKEFNTAKALISTDPKNAYLQLKNLEAIDADFPGLQAAITDSEYAAGIKVRPPDPKKLEKSTELYNLAYDIVSRNVRSEFPVALSYLDEAISLNPENGEAMILKDRIAVDAGGSISNILSNSDQKLYNEAVSEFTSGNYLKATIIIQKLLQKDENKKNPKILDLQKRIEQTR